MDLLTRIRNSWRQARGLPPWPPLTPEQKAELRSAYLSVPSPAAEPREVPEGWERFWWCWQPGCGATGCPLPGTDTLEAVYQHLDTHHPRETQ